MVWSRDPARFIPPPITGIPNYQVGFSSGYLSNDKLVSAVGRSFVPATRTLTAHDSSTRKWNLHNQDGHRSQATEWSGIKTVTDRYLRVGTDLQLARPTLSDSFARPPTEYAKENYYSCRLTETSFEAANKTSAKLGKDMETSKNTPSSLSTAPDKRSRSQAQSYKRRRVPQEKIVLGQLAHDVLMEAIDNSSEDVTTLPHSLGRKD